MNKALLMTRVNQLQKENKELKEKLASIASITIATSAVAVKANKTTAKYKNALVGIANSNLRRVDIIAKAKKDISK